MVLYACASWFLTLKEKNYVESFRVREISGPKGEEVAGGWRKLHNEELHNLYCSPYFIRVMKSWMMRWTGRVARLRDIWTPYNVSVDKHEWTRPVGNLCIDVMILKWSLNK
jgi:hypothetical protein